MNWIITRGYNSDYTITRGYNWLWDKEIAGLSPMEDVDGHSRMKDITGISPMVEELKNYDS